MQVYTYEYIHSGQNFILLNFNMYDELWYIFYPILSYPILSYFILSKMLFMNFTTH